MLAFCSSILAIGSFCFPMSPEDHAQHALDQFDTLDDGQLPDHVQLVIEQQDLIKRWRSEAPSIVS